VDKASYGRIQYFRSEEYPDRWRELWDIFSREAVWAGAYDKFAASKRKRGTSEVDSEFLKEIEGWRESLARNIALRNLYLGYDDLNTAVQRTIDRLIFLRMAEDRGSESYGQLLKLCEQPEIYARFMKLCRKADEKYNSGIFHFQKEDGVSEQHDRLTPALTIDDKVIKPILQNLYFEHGSPYHFGVLPVEILGTVYERFLGKVIRLTAEHRAKVEEKPEVRKAGGVYYTPAYIVEYIVKNTVGKMIEGKSPAQLSGGKNGQPLRVLDMACGSGSFLLGAYQCLLDHCLKWYLENHPAKHKEAVYLDSRGKYWRLAIAEKKRILITHIFGVDIDLQAVEVSKLSLLLKVLEGETDETVGQSRQLFHERALPNLSNNIKCGNSLIGPDYFSGRLIPDPDEMKRVNPFDWSREFPEAMKSGGFDCVIGNPPWGADFSENEKRYIDSSFSLNSGKYESYIFFVERATKLNKVSGFFGFIIPSYWVSRSQTETLRNHLAEHMTPMSFVVWPDNLFNGVKMDSCIIITKNTPSTLNRHETIDIGEISTNQLKEITLLGINNLLSSVPVDRWLKQSNIRFNPRIVLSDLEIFDKIFLDSVNLGKIVEISQGLTLYRRSTLTELYGKIKAEEIVEKRLFHANYKKDQTFKKELLGKDVSRYNVHWNGESWVSYGPWLAHAVDEKFFRGPRLVVQKIRNPSLKQRLVVGYLEDNEIYSAGVLLNLIPANSEYSILFIQGLLNSILINWWYRKSIIDVSIRIVDLNTIPIHQIDFSNPKDKLRHDKIISLVDSMISLNKHKTLAKTLSEKELIQRQIEATDREIDQLVYELYGLTEDEIKIVEDGTAK
ncbi:MAG: N-6 DNA methylase, partial [Acidobacteria bacterium]|nr:N-6 DNA methylase [Acidobacteriota bacterium]